MNEKWYPVENVLIGGWCVISEDEPDNSRLPEVADFLTEQYARHIAALHNDWLENGCE